MTFAGYIERQKSLIRSRRGEVKAERGRGVCEYDTEKLFAELVSLKGLNTAERMKYSKNY